MPPPLALTNYGATVTDPDTGQGCAQLVKERAPVAGHWKSHAVRAASQSGLSFSVSKQCLGSCGVCHQKVKVAAGERAPDRRYLGRPERHADHRSYVLEPF